MVLAVISARAEADGWLLSASFADPFNRDTAMGRLDSTADRPVLSGGKGGGRASPRVGRRLRRGGEGDAGEPRVVSESESAGASLAFKHVVVIRIQTACSVPNFME